MQAWGLSDPGVVRTQNQDAFVIQELEESVYLAVVCDGMGGARSGNVASQLALEQFAQLVGQNWKENLSDEEISRLLAAGVEQANQTVYATSCSDEAFEGMGTTLVAAIVQSRSL